MRRLLAGWNRFWFRDVDGLPLGAARIGIALTGVVLWAGMAPQVRHFYSDAGEWPIEAARVWSSAWFARFLMPDVLGSFPVAALLFALWACALVAFLLGWRTRAAAWANWILAAWFLHRNPTFNNGGDEVFRLVSLYLALAYTAVPARHRALTMDRLRSGADPAERTRVPAWTLRMVQIQIAVVYLVSGFWKVVGPPWRDGTALYYALANPSFTRFGAPLWAWLQLPFTLAALAISWWEFLFWALVLGRRTRLPALAFGVAMHLGIFATMSIGIFPFAMLGCYPAFLSGDEVRRVGGRWRRAGPPGDSQERSDSTASAPATEVG